MDNKASITLNISLPLDASKEEAVKAISAIEAFFDDGISPKDAKTVNDTISGNISNLFPATGVTAGTGATVTGSTISANTGTADKNGLPWDERIHSSSKNFNADGTWRYRKGVSADQKSKVEAELRAALAGNAAPAPITAPAIAAPTTLLPLPGAVTPAPLPPVTNPAFTEFVNFITANSPPITNEWLTAVLRDSFGVPNGDLQNLAHMPDKIPQITASIKAAIGVQ